MIFIGKMKNIDIEIHSTDNSLKIQRAIYRDLFQILPQKDIQYMLKKARGNNKIAMVLALGDLNE